MAGPVKEADVRTGAVAEAGGRPGAVSEGDGRSGRVAEADSQDRPRQLARRSWAYVADMRSNSSRVRPIASMSSASSRS